MTTYQLLTEIWHFVRFWTKNDIDHNMWYLPWFASVTSEIDTTPLEFDSKFHQLLTEMPFYRILDQKDLDLDLTMWPWPQFASVTSEIASSLLKTYNSITKSWKSTNKLLRCAIVYLGGFVRHLSWKLKIVTSKFIVIIQICSKTQKTILVEGNIVTVNLNSNSSFSSSSILQERSQVTWKCVLTLNIYPDTLYSFSLVDDLMLLGM